jgi:hypothetical protein
MNYIALTGSDMHAMATASEILLELVTARGIPAAILLHVNDVRTANCIYFALQPGEVGELWRIGPDHAHPLLTPLIDAFLAQADGRCVRAALAGFVRKLQPPPALTPSHQRTESTV